MRTTFVNVLALVLVWAMAVFAMDAIQNEPQPLPGRATDLVTNLPLARGSHPTKEGNGVSTSEATINYVTDGCKEGVCDHETARNGVVPQAAVDQTIDADIPVETFLATNTSENVHTQAAGANCKGSSQCKFCRASLDQILETLHKIPDDTEFHEGEKIACQVCNHEYFQGMCVFAQNLHRPIAAKDVKVIVQRLRNHPCGRCGSIPIREGSGLAQGMITANYMNRACAGKGHERAWGCPKREDSIVVPIPFRT